jgi:SAM-dependent methyltransferase
MMPMPERATTFGAVAAAYERFRPGYPDELADRVLAYARIPIRAALEIGAGTGKATRVFARRGIAVTATDPDPAMLAELRKHVPASVSVMEAAYEDLPLDRSYDLLFAGASLHWTDPVGRWSRAAALINHRGVLASFGGQMNLADEEVRDAVRAAMSPDLEDDGIPSPDGTPEGSPMQWPGTELARSEAFWDVRQSTIRRRTTMSASDYLGHLSTISAYLTLPGSARERVFARIQAVLPERVSLAADITLHLARRAEARA